MRLRSVLVLLVGLILAWVVGLGCWPFLTWSSLNCRCEDVDITSGKVRYQQYLFGFCVHERTVDTGMSLLVPSDDNGSPPEWRRVNTFSPLVHYSPHHGYHGAIYQIHLIDGMSAEVRFSPAARQRIIQDVLHLWQRDGSYVSASDYLQRVESLLSNSAGSPQKMIEAADLPSTDVAAK